MSEITFEIQDFSEQVKKACDEQIAKAMYVAGTDIVASTVDYMSKPDFTGKDIVDTGKLRQSISFITSEMASGKNNSSADVSPSANEVLTGRAGKGELIFGSNISYANFVNSGTVKQPARKFLQNGFYNSKDKVEKHIEKVLKGEL